MCNGIRSMLVLIFSITFTYDCLKIIPERASITYINETYLTNASLSIRRIRRRGDYAVNVDFVSKLSIGYNASIDLIFYEYLHNEFRRSFVEMHFKMCDLIHNDPYFGGIVRRAGMTKCPIPPGRTSLKNVNLNVDIPSVWPFEKGKGELTAIDDLSGVMIGRGEIVMTFKQK